MVDGPDPTMGRIIVTILNVYRIFENLHLLNFATQYAVKQLEETNTSAPPTENNKLLANNSKNMRILRLLPQQS